jgi:glycine oxidase
MANNCNSSHTADVLIIGRGLIGCSIALRLAQAGLRVSVLDRGELGTEASAAAAGMLAPHGETVEPDAFFDLCLASRDLYPQFVDEVERFSGESVSYQREGTLLVSLDEEGEKELNHVHLAQQKAGHQLERLSSTEAARRLAGLSPEIRGGLFVPGDHWVDNQRLTAAVIAVCRKLGVTLCGGRPVTKLNVRSGRVESVDAGYGPSAEPGSRFSAGQVVLAAGCWSRELVTPLGIVLPMEPCRGQMLEFDAPAELPLVLRSGIHYLVPRSSQRVLVGTTAEYVGYEKAVTGEGLRSILEGAIRLFPGAKAFRLRRAWAGLRPDTADHLPILGRGEIENLIFATGHFRNGILLAPITAQLISDLVLHKSVSHPIDAYRPTRFA